MGFYQYLTDHIKWGIRRDDIVVDIGAGNDPILRANFLIDKYVHTDAERYSGIIIDRPLINADGDNLPIKNKSIDFLHCRHVLEHIPKPEKFISELERVAKRGIIITPNGDYPKLCSSRPACPVVA